MSKPGKDDHLGKDDNLRDLIGCSGWSKTQKVQRIHEVQIIVCFFYAIITLLFMWFLQGLCYDKYAPKEVVVR